MTYTLRVERQPEPLDVRTARKRAMLTLAQAANLVHLSSGSRWAEYESGKFRIPRASWELFLIKTGLHPNATLVNQMIVLPYFI